jgi:hypothetical protein
LEAEIEKERAEAVGIIDDEIGALEKEMAASEQVFFNGPFACSLASLVQQCT